MVKRIRSRETTQPRRFWRWTAAVTSAVGLTFAAPMAAAQETTPEAPGLQLPGQTWQGTGDTGSTGSTPPGACEVTEGIDGAELLAVAADPTLLEGQQIELSQVEIVQKIGDKALLVKPVGNVVEDLKQELSSTGSIPGEAQPLGGEQQPMGQTDTQLGQDYGSPLGGTEPGGMPAGETQLGSTGTEHEGLLLVMLDTSASATGSQELYPSPTMNWGDEEAGATDTGEAATTQNGSPSSLDISTLEVGQVVTLRGQVQKLDSSTLQGLDLGTGSESASPTMGDTGTPTLGETDTGVTPTPTASGGVDLASLEEHHIYFKAQSIERDQGGSAPMP